MLTQKYSFDLLLNAASLLMGLMLRNLPAPGNIGSYIDDETSIILRRLALTVILTRAGLEIDPEVQFFFQDTVLI